MVCVLPAAIATQLRSVWVVQFFLFYFSIFFGRFFMLLSHLFLSSSPGLINKYYLRRFPFDLPPVYSLLTIYVFFMFCSSSFLLVDKFAVFCVMVLSCSRLCNAAYIVLFQIEI